MFHCLQTKAGWDSPVELNKDVFDEIIFWQENSSMLNGQPLVAVPESEFACEIFSDASHMGYGGYILNKRGSEVLGAWSNEESLESSTWRELWAVNRVFCSVAKGLEGQTIKWYTDNQNVKQILEVGSRKPRLHKITLDTKFKCVSVDAKTFMHWVPRSQNVQADFLSKCKDRDDWQITNAVFTALDQQWGPHSVDRFATDYNTKCRRFNSRWWCPGTEAVEAIEENWANNINWLVPPPRLISKALTKLKVDKARGTLIVPEWRSAPFWALLASGTSVYWPLQPTIQYI